MKELDQDRDGGISRSELFNALAGTKSKMVSRDRSPFGSSSPLPGLGAKSNAGVEYILDKIRKSVAHLKSK